MFQRHVGWRGRVGVFRSSLSIIDLDDRHTSEITELKRRWLVMAGRGKKPATVYCYVEMQVRVRRRHNHHQKAMGISEECYAAMR